MGGQTKHARWSLVVEISSGELASFCASAVFDGGGAGERGQPRVWVSCAALPTFEGNFSLLAICGKKGGFHTFPPPKHTFRSERSLFSTFEAT